MSTIQAITHILLNSEGISHKAKTHRQCIGSAIVGTTKFSSEVFHIMSKVKVRVLRYVQKPGSYWERSSALPLVGVKLTQR